MQPVVHPSGRVSFIYIPRHHDYNTSTWSNEPLCSNWCTVWDYIVIWFIISIVALVVITMWCMLYEITKR